jgi:hypothetical protein
VNGGFAGVQPVFWVLFSDEHSFVGGEANYYRFPPPNGHFTGGDHIIPALSFGQQPDAGIITVGGLAMRSPAVIFF